MGATESVPDPVPAVSTEPLYTYKLTMRERTLLAQAAVQRANYLARGFAGDAQAADDDVTLRGLARRLSVG